MNFYKHHIGDYAAATSHLSILEDGAYSRLIRLYYRDEGPLPADVKVVQRLAAARSRDEREAVQTVLEEFFELRDDGWHQARCDEELERWRAQAETNRRVADEREARKRERLGNVRITNRSEDGHETSNESSHELFNESSAVREPSQKPLARSQKPEERSKELQPTAEESELGSDAPHQREQDRCPYQAILALYHERLPMCRHVEKLTEARRGYIRQRWREDLPTLDAWKNFFTDVAASKFLTGRTEGRNGQPPFVADLEWLTRPSNFAKIAEGKYHE